MEPMNFNSPERDSAAYYLRVQLEGEDAKRWHIQKTTGFATYRLVLQQLLGGTVEQPAITREQLVEIASRVTSAPELNTLIERELRDRIALSIRGAADQGRMTPGALASMLFVVAKVAGGAVYGPMGPDDIGVPEAAVFPALGTAPPRPAGDFEDGELERPTSVPSVVRAGRAVVGGTIEIGGVPPDAPQPSFFDRNWYWFVGGIVGLVVIGGVVALIVASSRRNNQQLPAGTTPRPLPRRV